MKFATLSAMLAAGTIAASAATSLAGSYLATTEGYREGRWPAYDPYVYRVALYTPAQADALGRGPLYGAAAAGNAYTSHVNPYVTPGLRPAAERRVVERRPATTTRAVTTTAAAAVERGVLSPVALAE